MKAKGTRAVSTFQMVLQSTTIPGFLQTPKRLKIPELSSSMMPMAMKIRTITAEITSTSMSPTIAPTPLATTAINRIACSIILRII